LRTLDAHSDNEGTYPLGGEIRFFLGETIYLDYIETTAILKNMHFRLYAPGVEGTFFCDFCKSNFKKERRKEG
jgi:hypothetical protein